MTEIALFILILFGVTWPWGVLVTPAAMSYGQWIFLAAFLPMVWMPTFIALSLAYWTQDAETVRRELRARLSVRNGRGIILLAGATPLVIGAVALGVARAVGDGAPFLPSTALLTSILIQIISGSTGEELGWRGFLLPRLRSRVGTTGGAVVMGILWAFWHVPAFYTPGMPHRFMPMGPMLMLIAVFGVFLAALFYRAGDSVLPTMAAHISLNVILGIGGVNLASFAFWMTMVVLTTPVAFISMRWSSAARQHDLADKRVVA